ncbi:hypothetical protein MOQ72_40180 [Saccharopolyspora sp. K220]|uniref:hypothetical protein n=1 Tax=Saccharopolyspora soli TaxID=2926618 RepID=UPI001F57878C|nr:hypothetical protein [Saccharopolyspora soli]MCI2423642.1 hypothetical protein [Saccharopolyspora soli]
MCRPLSQRMIDAAGACIEADTEKERRLQAFFDGVDDPGGQRQVQHGIEQMRDND